MLRMCLKTLDMNKYLFKIYNRRSYATEAKFEVLPYRLHRLTQGPSTEVTITKDDALDMYKKMSIIRKMETAANLLYKAKLIRGFCHLYSGQEAIAVGVYSVLRSVDSFLTSYRNHAWAYLINKDVKGVLAELLGKKTGCSRGKGGSMHMYGPKFFGGNAIVGAQVPLGVGIALAHKYKNQDGVCIVGYGDGASNNGQVFEAFNISKLWNVPCIFLCENNLYSMGTSIWRSTANTSLYVKGDTIPGIWIDGMDVLAVKQATKFAIDMCSSDKGPIILEAETYRYFGHSLSDPGTSYRTHDEIQKMRKTRDPISNFKEKIINANLTTADELKQIDKQAKKIVDKAVEDSKADKDPGIEELTWDIYANNVINQIRNVSFFAPLPHKASGLSQNLK